MDLECQKRIIGDIVLCEWTLDGRTRCPVILMLHGLTGDEHSMSIFVHRLPKEYKLIAPRGIFPSRLGGFSWQESENDSWPPVSEFMRSTEVLFELLIPENFPDADLSQLNLLGFSQGAALAYTMAIAYPEKIGRVAGISGFVPEKIDEFIESRPLAGKEIYVAHGKLDEMVPIEKAWEVVEKLTRGGAEVGYCEEEVGHKLSASCFRGVEIFFKLT